MAVPPLANTTALQVGNVGTRLLLHVVDQYGAPLDLSAATALWMFLRNPADRLLKKAATPLTTGTDGIIQYTTVAGDIDLAGDWQVQALAVLGPKSFYSNTVRMPVKDNIAP